MLGQHITHAKTRVHNRILHSLLFCIIIAPSSVSAGFLDIFTDKNLSNGNRFAFVASQLEPSIIAIDTSNNKLADVLNLSHISGPIVISEKLDKLFATDPDNQVVSVVDLVTREVVKKINITMRPEAAILSPIDRYVAFGSLEGSVSVWDMLGFTEVLRIDGLESGLNLSFSFDGTKLYVVEPNKKNIAVIEIKSKSKIADISLGDPVETETEISPVSRSANGYTGFVSVISENRVVVLDLIKLKVKKSIPVGRNPIRPYSTADNRYILIPHRGDKTLIVLSALSFEIIATIPTGIEAKELNTGWLETVAFVMPEHGKEIAIVDLDKLSYAGTINLDGQPDDGLVTADTKKLFTALADSGEVVAINTRMKSLENKITTPVTGLQGINIAISNNICH